MHTDPKKIAIYLTNKCNLKCKHCFIEGSPINEQFLTWNQIEIALNYFHKLNYRFVEFTGGEPCFSPFIAQSAKLAHKLGYSVGVNTNGTNPQIFTLISKSFVNKITFSLDGATAPTHDHLRGKGVYQLCLKTVKRAISLGYRVDVIFTVHHYNLQDIPEVIKLLDKLGVYQLSLNFIDNAGTATLHQNFLLTPQKWIEAKSLIEKNQKTKHLKIRYPVLFVTPKDFKNKIQPAGYHCLIPDEIKVDLYPDGYFYHCCRITDSKELASGHITDSKVVIHRAKLKRFINQNRHLSCPAYQTKPHLYPPQKDLTPLCVYWKNFIPAKP
jgi:MoaA/NifB/PqqE/SkfB family radical SAM enzyme